MAHAKVYPKSISKIDVFQDYKKDWHKKIGWLHTFDKNKWLATQSSGVKVANLQFVSMYWDSCWKIDTHSDLYRLGSILFGIDIW